MGPLREGLGIRRYDGLDEPSGQPGDAFAKIQLRAFLGRMFPGGGLYKLTYYGGNPGDDARYVHVAPATLSIAYVVGAPGSTDLSFPGGGTGCSGSLDTFLVGMNLGTSPVSVHSGSCTGGSYADIEFGVDGDVYGNIYVVGYTESPDFPTTSGASQTTSGGQTTRLPTAKGQTRSRLSSAGLEPTVPTEFLYTSTVPPSRRLARPTCSSQDTPPRGTFPQQVHTTRH